MQIFTGAPNAPFIGEVQAFTILFVMLGPINYLATFVRITKDASLGLQRRIALRANAIADVSIVLSAAVGVILLGKWRISVAALAIAAAVVLFMVAVRSLLALYGRAPASDDAPPSIDLAISPIAFPQMVTPYGVATLILLVVLEPENWLTILMLLAIVMAINFLLTFYARQIWGILRVPLGLLQVVLTVLQLAVSIQFLLFGIRMALLRGA